MAFRTDVISGREWGRWRQNLSQNTGRRSM